MSGKQINFRWFEPVLIGLSVALIAFQIVFYYLPYENGIDPLGRYFGNDFINIWFGTKLAVTGRIDLLFTIKEYFSALRDEFGNITSANNWGYPPFAVLLLWPLGYLNYFVAYVLFTLGFFALFLIAGLRLLQPAQPVRLLCLTALAPACLFNILCGQSGFITGALLFAAYQVLMLRPRLAGALFGILAFKPQLGVLIPIALVTQRRWQTIIVACITVVGLVAASIAIFGIQPWVDCLTITAEHQRGALESYAGHYAQILISPYAALRSLGLGYNAAMAGQGLATLLAMAATVLAFRSKTATMAERLLVLCTAMPLAVPYCMAYDLPACSMLLAYQLCQPGQPKLRLMVYSFAWLGPAFVWMANRQSNCIIQLGLLLTLWMVLRQIAARKSSTA